MAVNKKIGWCKNTDWYELQLQLLRFTMYGLEGLGEVGKRPAWGKPVPGMMPFSFGKRTTARRFDVSSVLFLFLAVCVGCSLRTMFSFYDEKAEEKILQTPCYFFLFYCLSFPFVLQ